MKNKNLPILALLLFTHNSFSQEVNLASLKPKTTYKTLLATCSSGVLAGGMVLCGLTSLGFIDDGRHSDPSELSLLDAAFNTFCPTRWLYEKKFNVSLKQLFPLWGSRTITLLSTVVGACVARYAYTFSPEGKYKDGHAKLMRVINDEMLQRLIDGKQTLIENVLNVYVQSPYPCVVAYNKFVKVHKTLAQAITLFTSALEASDNSELVSMARICINEAEALRVYIEGCINILRSSPRWIDQVAGYDLLIMRKSQQQLTRDSRSMAADSVMSTWIMQPLMYFAM